MSYPDWVQFLQEMGMMWGLEVFCQEQITARLSGE